MENGQDIIHILENKSKWFAHLKPQEKMFVVEYSTNGFNGDKAASRVSNKSDAVRFLEKQPIQEAIKEFVAVVLADRAEKLESKIVDVLWRRAFYNPLDFIDQNGQPLTPDGSPFDPDEFDLKNYKEMLGPWSVCIDNIKNAMHPKNPDVKSVTVVLADRDRALRQLSTYAGLINEDEGKDNSFVVNINVGESPEQKYEIKPFTEKKK